MIPASIILTLIGYYGGDNFILITIGFLGNILLFISLIGALAHLALWLTEKLRRKPKLITAPSEQSPSWLTNNWFKLGILILITIVVAIYAYSAYQNQKPKTLNEAIEREMYKRMSK